MYPRRKDKFVMWSKAMVEGATIDKPHYPGTKNPTRAMRTTRRKKRRKKRPRGSKE